MLCCISGRARRARPAGWAIDKFTLEGKRELGVPNETSYDLNLGAIDNGRGVSNRNLLWGAGLSFAVYSVALFYAFHCSVLKCRINERCCIFYI
ncbi:hypothetical protein XAB3213_980003 [Xanthomonas citri pv. bilvae]|nr:hypothetical protein XAB3213_980003 [Xanthomonas citri pv. bilvae]